MMIDVLYPAQAGARFDWDYYLGTHVPRVTALLSPQRGYRGITVQKGTSGLPPGTPPPFVAIFRMEFATLADFEAAFGPHAGEIQGDIPNYTNIVPSIQFSEVVTSA